MEMIIDRSLQPSIRAVDQVSVMQARRFDLDNGIPVYAITAGFQDLIKLELIFPNKHFDPKNPLLDSVTNRMMAEGTSKYTAEQLAESIDYYGAFYETDENSDFTSINLFTLNKHLPETLPFLTAILHNPVFPERELNIKVQNSKQRLAVENEKVSSLARRKFNETIFGGEHPYGHFVQKEDYDLIQREDLAAHHRLKYNASNCTIIISGLVRDESIQLLNKFLGQRRETASNGGLPQGIPFGSGLPGRFHLEKENAVQSAYRIGKPFFNRTHTDYPGMAVLNTILGGYFGSRLMSNIREDKGYTYSIGSAIVSMKQGGYFFITAEVGAEVTNAAIEETYKEIIRLQQEPVDSEELDMVRNFMTGTFLKSTDGAFQLAERFKSVYLYGLDYTYYDRYLDKIKNIGADEIQSLAVQYLKPESFYQVVVGRK